MIRIALLLTIVFFTCTVQAHQLGSVVEQFESKGNTCAVSSGYNDKGGVSYGLYQFSSSYGIVQAFVANYGHLLGLYSLSDWRKACSRNREKFTVFQRVFAYEHYFCPIRALADTYHIPNTIIINEALFSAAIHHGNWRHILKQSLPYTTEDDWLDKFYLERRNYVSSLDIPDSIKKAIYNRYTREKTTVKELRDYPHAIF